MKDFISYFKCIYTYVNIAQTHHRTNNKQNKIQTRRHTHIHIRYISTQRIHTHTHTHNRMKKDQLALGTSYIRRNQHFNKFNITIGCTTCGSYVLLFVINIVYLNHLLIQFAKHYVYFVPFFSSLFCLLYAVVFVVCSFDFTVCHYYCCCFFLFFSRFVSSFYLPLLYHLCPIHTHNHDYISVCCFYPFFPLVTK